MRAGWYGVEHWLQDGVYAGRLVWSGGLVAGWGVCGQASVFCFVLFCFVKNALARVVLVPSRRLPIFSSVVRFPFPFITRAFFFLSTFFY